MTPVVQCRRTRCVYNQKQNCLVASKRGPLYLDATGQCEHYAVRAQKPKAKDTTPYYPQRIVVRHEQ